MAENLGHDAEDLLQSALSDAFSPTEIPRVSTQPPAPPAQQQEAVPPPPPAAEPTGDSAADDSWKTDLDAHLAEWRAESAEQRARAEAERAKWEAIRAQEEKEGKEYEDRVLGERRKSLKLSPNVAGIGALSESSASVSVSEWESVPAERTGRESPSPADVRDLVTGEKQGQRHTAAASQSNAHSRPLSESSKQDKWEDIPSDLASSYPSLDYPSDPHSPSSSHPNLRHRHEHGHDHHEHGHHHTHEVQKTATSAIFDSSLSTKTRVLAFASALAINLMLPFINGVMLGFGEIFAKNVVVGWLGWKVPGSVAANVGVRARGRGPEVRPKGSM